MSLLFTDGVHFRVADSAFQLLHLISALQSLCSKQSPPSSLSIILLSSLALESCALQVKNCGSPPKARFTIPTFHPLRFSNQTSCLSLACCSTWSDAIATPNIRALFIPSIIEHLGSCAPAAELPSLLTSMCAASTPPMQLYPPFSWHELTCFKDSVFKQFGSAFMLNAHWLPLPTDASLPAVAEQVVRIHPNAHIMMKGHFSACSSAAVPLQIRHGRCDQLKPALRDLFSTCQQRCIGIQLFVQALRKFEQRTYLVPDPAAAHGWRQCVHVTTGIEGSDRTRSLSSLWSAQQQAPTHGLSLKIAGFVDQLLRVHAPFFQRALDLQMPLLRIDCGFDPATDRCFLNELMGPVNTCCYTAVHEQGLVYVIGVGLAEGLWKAMFGS